MVNDSIDKITQSTDNVLNKLDAPDRGKDSIRPGGKYPQCQILIKEFFRSKAE
jgi:hypothetical protein